MPSPLLNYQFTLNIKSHNANITIIPTKRLFWNIEQRLFDKRLTKKIVHKVYKFFLDFAKHMSFKDQITFYITKSG